MKALAEFFQEDNGGFSMTRLIVFFVIVIPFLVWVAICIVHRELVDMPGGILTFQGGALATKLVQKGQESKAPVPPDPAPTA